MFVVHYIIFASSPQPDCTECVKWKPLTCVCGDTNSAAVIEVCHSNTPTPDEF